MLHRSYKLRVALWSSILSGLVLLVFMAGVSYNLKTEFAEIVDHDMEAAAAALLVGAEHDAFAEDPFTYIGRLDEGSYRGALYSEENLENIQRNFRLLAIRRPDGSFSYKNDVYWNEEYVSLLDRFPEVDVGADLSDLERENEPEPEVEAEGARWEVRRYYKNEYSIYCAINQHENEDEWIAFVYFGAFTLPIAFAVIALGGWWLGVYASKPICEISGVVSSIKAEDLTTRVPHADRKDEIGELACLVNDMLHRIEQGYAQAKRFTADASHELRTPLAILQGELEARMRNSTHGDAAGSSRMLEEIRRLKTLTHSLLYLSKADAGNLKVEKEPLDFSSLVLQTFGDLEEISRPFELDFDASGVEPGIRLEGDASLLQQTIMNLFRNAAKFNRKGGKVACSLSKQAGFACLIVGNSGPGIPLESRDKVFDRFHRVDAGRNRDKGGFGLGLNIAREIARSHGGEIALLEGREDWTEFELRLPLV